MTVQASFLARRPDVGRIALSCNAAEVELPYADLVNEILETKIGLTEADPWPTDTVDTTSTADELLAEREIKHLPQYLAAYGALAVSVFPLTAPFHLWLEEARAYLTHLGVPRHDLIRVLQVSVDVSDEWAPERLGVPTLTRAVIVGSDSSSLARCWGYTSGSDSTIAANLSAVPALLLRSGLTLEELRELVASGVGAGLVLHEPTPCDVPSMTLTGMDATKATAVHRFLRLRSALEMSITDADKLVSTLGPVSSNTAFFNVAAFFDLISHRSLSPTEGLALFADIDVRASYADVPPLFDSLFLDKKVIAPPDPAFASRFLPTPPAGETLDGHRAALRAGLRITDAELRVLIDSTASANELSLMPVVSASAALTLPNVSRLYRVARLAQAAGVRPRDVRVAQQLSGLNVLAGDVDGVPPTPSATSDFADLLELLGSSRLSVGTLHYLARDVDAPSQPLRPNPLNVTAWCNQILAAMQKAVAQTLKNADHGGSDDPRESGRGAVVSAVASIFQLSPAVAEFLLSEHLKQWSTGKLIDAFLPAVGSGTTDPVASVSTDWPGLLRLLNKMALVVNSLSLTVEELTAFYPGTPAAPGGAGLPAVDFSIMPAGPAQPAAAAPTTTEQAQFNMLVRMVKYAALRDAWPTGSGGLLAIFASAAASSPVFADVCAQIAVQASWSTDDVIAVSTRFGFSAAAGSAPHASSFQNEQPLLILQSVLSRLQRIGCSAASGISWTILNPSTVPLPTLPLGATSAWTMSADIKRSARARYDEAGWDAVARPLKDSLRDKQRDALVAYTLTTDSHYPLVPGSYAYQPSDIFEYLYVDAEMNHCQLTSRIVHAAGSIQLYMARALLGLENFVPSEDAAHEWEFMKNFRVWEANRKVFLYPESYMLPELRDDKTPLFSKLEQALQQSDVNSDTAERAFRNYLEGLDELSNLEIVAMHTEFQDSTVINLAGHRNDTIHLFGRTRAPRKYYYRARANGAWSPWESVDVDIEGDHLIPAIVNGKLVLAWPVIDNVATKAGNDPSDKARTTATELRIRMAYAEKTFDGWSSKRLATDADAGVRLGASTHTSNLSFTKEVTDGTLTITAYVFGSKSKGSDRGKAFPKPTPWYWKAAVFSVDPCATFAGNGLTNTFAPTKVSLTNPLQAQVAAWMKKLFNVSVPDGSDSKVVGDLICAVTADGDVVDDLVVIGPTGSTQFNTVYQGFIIGTPDTYQPLKLEGETVFKFTDLVPGTVITSRDAEPDYNHRYYVFQDGRRTYVIEKADTVAATVAGANVGLVNGGSFHFPASHSVVTGSKWRTSLLYHPYVCAFRTALAEGGLDGLLKWSTQGSSKLQMRTASHDDFYVPTSKVESLAQDQVEFDAVGGAYGIYNWELFFHAPLLIATRLSENQKFADARRWFHYIFDPGDGSTATGVQKFWKVKPLYDNKDLVSIQTELETLAESTYAKQIASWSTNSDNPDLQSLLAQIEVSQEDPFNPWAIARLRMVAYQKMVVLKYIQNLIAWGDQLFAQDSIESINEATQLYVLADKVLGPRPTIVEKPPTTPKCFDELGALDAFGNAAVELESATPNPRASSVVCNQSTPKPQSVFGGTYFCIPQNEDLLGLWDTIADRLFKIRHCMNIAGQVRQLPLFQPPIDPLLLVRAQAAGVDIDSLFGGELSMNTPAYRYPTLYAKAQEFVGAVQSLGSSLLSALEKRDAEELAQLRATQDVEVQTLILASKQSAIKEAQSSLDALEASRAKTQIRYDFYANVDPISPLELLAGEASAAAQVLGAAAQAGHSAASSGYAAPDAVTGDAGIAGPVVIVVYGGTNVGNASSSQGDGLQAAAMVASDIAQDINTAAVYDRRQDDWDRERDIAKAELAEMDKQILAGQFRLELAQDDLATVQKQIEHAKAVETFYRTKYTNQDLYEWMKGQTSALYFQSYSLAYEMAKRAEAAFQFERGEVLSGSGQSFIAFGYWDSLKQGLLAGERLALDLRRCDAAYHAQNRRDLELVKMVSLAKHAPEQLLRLRECGIAEFSLSEGVFDRDFKMHYLRRLTAVSATLECTTGPYDGVQATLSLDGQRAATRLTSTASSVTVRPGVVNAIAISQGQNDAGVFELNFKDERYLPFEGAGAHYDASNAPAVGSSLVPGQQWTFQLSEGNELPYDSITDLVFQLRYTARADVTSRTPSRSRTLLLRLRSDFADAWEAFQAAPSTGIVVTLPLSLYSRGKKESAGSISGVRVYGRWKTVASQTMTLTGPGSPSLGTTSTIIGGSSALTQRWSSTFGVDVADGQTWTVKPGPATDLEDVWVIFDYTTVGS